MLKYQNKRIEYIDALRGFTMILVVFSHVELFTFKYLDSFVNQVFISFRMPLFFFISGFIGYKANIIMNRNTWCIMSGKKCLIQLFPTLIFGFIYTLAYRHLDLNTFIFDDSKLGYWFTFVLLEMFLILYTLNLVLYNSNSEILKKRQVISLIVLSILFLCSKLIIDKYPNKLVDALSFNYLFKYFSYFAFGFICSMNKILFNKILQDRWFSTAIIALFICGFYVNYFHLDSIKYSNIIYLLLYNIIIIGFWGLLIVYNTFRVYQNSFTSDRYVGRLLQYIGKRTLDIYLLHFFFLPNVSQIGDILKRGNNVVLELTIGILISIIVIGLCLCVSNILRTSPILSKYLFGVKS